MRRVWLLVGLAAVVGCADVRSRVRRAGPQRYAPHRGPLVVSGTRDPPGGELLGEVEVSGIPPNGNIEALMPELLRRAGGMGGNYARIDHIQTRLEWRMVPVTSTYNCGYRVYTPCTTTSWRSEEFATTRIEGRAFRVEAGP
ncbi:MAG: hypothetical protein HY909_13385 [Deltaproteobacteria bacterium]|nr:hypothetical protein [Deltaproteobacteria bacterium]